MEAARRCAIDLFLSFLLSSTAHSASATVCRAWKWYVPGRDWHVAPTSLAVAVGKARVPPTVPQLMSKTDDGDSGVVRYQTGMPQSTASVLTEIR